MEIKARRARLHVDNLRAEHVGLLLNRYLSQHDDTHEGAKKLYEQAKDTPASAVYRTAFQRWREHLQRLPNTCVFVGTAATPVAVGLGNESVLEVGLTIHHIYGVPIIPGSALKGLCRRGALRLQKQGKLTQQQFDVLLGTSADDDNPSAGYITFWDAWYDPESVQGKPFHRDVITVHHVDYYSKRGQDAYPTDFDDPNPVPFLVVKPGARFLFALSAPDRAWAEFAQNLLKWCLREMGVGAKTNAGYGYFTAGDVPKQPPSSTSAQPKSATQPSAGAPASNREVWQGVVVSYNPGQRTLQVQRQAHGRTESASADAERTQLLIATLPEPARVKLTQGRRRLVADVDVEVSGNKRTIVKITPKE